MILVALNVLLDYQFTRFHNSAFYISESLLFSSYWLLFIPLVYLQLTLIRKTDNSAVKLACSGAAIIAHQALYPAVIWIVSDIVYDHTFSYWQTFNFGLSAYFIKSAIIYLFTLLATVVLPKKHTQPQPISEQSTQPNHLRSLIVSDSNHQKLVLSLHDIFYFSANPPYVTIHLPLKKYLQTETLKALESQLNGEQFVRIHKSYIVNLNKVRSYQSRQNGDYDLTLSDETVIRVSRNYAKEFKTRFEKFTRLTAE